MLLNTDNNRRLTILVIPGLMPFPPNDGGKLCVYGFIDYLRRYHNIHLLLMADSEGDKNYIEQLQSYWPEVSISHVDLFQRQVMPSNKTKFISIAKKFLKAFINLFQARQVPAPENVYNWYQVNRTTPFYPHHVSFIQKLESILSNTQFDIIQTELTWMLNLVNFLPVNSKKVFVQIENKSDVLYDYGISNDIHRGYLEYVVKNTEFLEYSYMAKYDAVFVLNESDRKRVQENLPDVMVYNSPYGILDRDIKKPDFGEYVSENLIFMGGENHYPNVDALEWFLSDIIPLFENRPFRKLLITGSWTDKTKERLSAMDKSVVFIGFVEDLDPYLKNSVSIVPIRIGGGGIRTKILLAMAKCSPVVATSISAVGIGDANQNELVIADSAQAFAASIKLLFSDRSKAREIISNAYELINNKFSQHIVSELRNRYYLELTCKNYESLTAKAIPH